MSDRRRLTEVQGVSFPIGLFDRIDRLRGYEPRSHFISRVLDEYVTKLENKGTMPGAQLPTQRQALVTSAHRSDKHLGPKLEVEAYDDVKKRKA